MSKLCQFVLSLDDERLKRLIDEFPEIATIVIYELSPVWPPGFREMLQNKSIPPAENIIYEPYSR